MKAVLNWLQANRVMLINSGSLVGTTAVTSVLGFVYWWLAARQFSPESVGIASAAVSLMTLLGGFCILGLGTLLITELPRQPGQELSLITTALVVVGGIGAGVGALFAALAPFASAQFNPLRATAGNIVVFAAGVSLTTTTIVLDQALIGILRGSWQFGRNTFFAVAKLLLLLAAPVFLSQKTGAVIYAGWALGIALSFAVLCGFALYRHGWPGKAIFPQWGLLRKLGLAALQHHLLNLMIQAPNLLLPVVVTVMLSAEMNAWFYVAWMVANFVLVVPYALTTTLHAMSSAQQSALRHRARITMGIAFATSLAANCFIQVAAKQVLGLFGGSYAAQATGCLRILLLVALPSVIISHYTSICRIQDRIAPAMRGMVIWGILQLLAAVVGAHLGGLLGLSLGLFLAITLEAVFMLPTVYRVVWRVTGSPLPPPTEGSESETEAIWLADTIMLAALPSMYTVGAQLGVAAFPKRAEPLQRESLRGSNNAPPRSQLRRVRLQRLPRHEDPLWRPSAREEADMKETIAHRSQGLESSVR